jgi:hypothetical protein
MRDPADEYLEFMNGPLPHDVESAIQALERAGCVRTDLLVRVAMFFIVSPIADAETRGKLFALDTEKRDLEATIYKIFKTADAVRRLNATTAVSYLLQLNQEVSEECPAPLWGPLETLPDLLEKYAGLLGCCILLAQASPFSNASPSMFKWHILKYVRETTGEPNYKLLSDLLHAVANSRNLVLDGDGDQLGEDALRKLWDRTERNKSRKCEALEREIDQLPEESPLG